MNYELISHLIVHISEIVFFQSNGYSGGPRSAIVSRNNMQNIFLYFKHVFSNHRTIGNHHMKIANTVNIFARIFEISYLLAKYVANTIVRIRPSHFFISPRLRQCTTMQICWPRVGHFDRDGQLSLWRGCHRRVNYWNIVVLQLVLKA